MNFGKKTMLGRYSERTLIRMIRRAEAEERASLEQRKVQKEEAKTNAKSKSENR